MNSEKTLNYPTSFMDYIGECIDVNGGLSTAAIEKLVDVMRQCRDKLVPKCMALTIISLSSIDVQMKLCESGVWNILFQWLQDGLKHDTTCFIVEILKLYLKLPITFENLTSNACPKLIKKLTKSGSEEIISISKSIVVKWKKVVEERTTKESSEVPAKKIRLDEKSNDDNEQPVNDEKKKVRTVKVRNTDFRSAGIEDTDSSEINKPNKKIVKKVDEKGLSNEDLHQKVNVTVDKKKSVEIHESKNFINSITQTPAPPRKKKKRPEPNMSVNKSISDLSLTDDSASEINTSLKKSSPSESSPVEKTKKRVSWAPSDTLQTIRYFELDENERVNVNKVSIEEMRKREKLMERQHVGNHKMITDDLDDDSQVEKWTKPIAVSGITENKVDINSIERNVQMDRERKVLKVFYFSKEDIPSTPSEPDIESYDVKDPKIIPLDDISNSKTVSQQQQASSKPATQEEQNSKLLIYTEKEGSERKVTLRPDVASLLKSMTQPSQHNQSMPIVVTENNNHQSIMDPNNTNEGIQTRTKLINIIRSRYPDIDPEKLTSEEVCKLLEPMREQLIREGILTLPTNNQNIAIPPPNYNNPMPPQWYGEPRPPHFAPLMAQRIPMPFPNRPLPPFNNMGRPPTRPVCKYFATSGFCRMGNSCGFSHILPPDCNRSFNQNRR